MTRDEMKAQLKKLMETMPKEKALKIMIARENAKLWAYVLNNPLPPLKPKK